MSHGRETEGRASSTTISTVVVQAGALHITIAVLKSGTLVRLQLAESEPNLLEIGSSKDETRGLLRDHEQLLCKLKKHGDGGWGLLEQADRTTAARPQLGGVVGDAMMETLSDTWRTLIALLERRGQLLQLASEFYTCALEFAEQIDEAEGFQRDTEEVNTIPTTTVCLEELLQKHSCMKRGLLQKSMLLMNKSRELLDVLRDFGAEPALPGPAATRGANTSCRRVECLMEILQDRRRQVDQRLRQHSLQLESLLRISKWKQRQQEVARWFKDSAEVYFQKDQLGSTLSENEELLEACKEFTVRAKEWSSRVEELLAEASGMMAELDGVDKEKVAEKKGELMTLQDELWHHLVDQQKDLQEAQAFFSAANKASGELARVEAELRSQQDMTLPQKARRHEDLQRVAREAVSEPLRLGQGLFQRLRPHSAQVSGVQRMLEHLQEWAESLSKDCHAHRELAGKKQRLVSSIEDLLDQVSVWLKSTNVTLSSTVEPGLVLSQAEDVLNRHLELSAQAQDVAGELRSAVELVAQLEVLECAEATQFSGRSSLLGEELKALSRNLHERVETLRIYVCFLHVAEEVDERLQHLQQGYRERPQEEASEEMPDRRWHSLLERFLTMQDLGSNFIRCSSITISKSLSLDVKAAVGVVQKTMVDLSKKKADVMDLWTSWQVQVGQMKSAKKQWKKFKEQVKKTVHDLETTGELLTPVSKVDLGSDLVTVTKVQENFNRIKPQLMQLNAEVEYLVKISELLTLRGVPVKEKNEKVAELLQLHQRMRDKAKEYERLLSTALRFHQLYNELENLLTPGLLATLPSASQAQIQLTQHQERRNHARHLYRLAITLGTEVTNSMHHLHALGFSAQQLQWKLERLERDSEGWWAEAERREENLLSSMHQCLFKEELHELRESFKDLKKKFNNLKFSYMKRNDKARNLKAVKNQIQQIELYVEKLQVLKKKMQTFAVKVSTSTEKHLVGSSLREMEDAVNELQQQIGDLGRTVEDYKQSLETTAQLQQAMDEYQFWSDEASAAIVRVGKYSSECTTKEAVTVLYKQFEKFVWPMVPQQEQRIQQITELAVRLHGSEEGKKFVEKTITKHNEIVESIKELCNGLMDLEAKLQGKEVKETLKTNHCGAEALDNKPEQKRMQSKGATEESMEMRELKESGHTPENATPGSEKEALARWVQGHSERSPVEPSHILPEAHSETVSLSNFTVDSAQRTLVMQQTQGSSRICDVQRVPQERVQAPGGFQETPAIVHDVASHSDTTSHDASVLLEHTEVGVAPMQCDLQPDLLTEESLSNDEYECTSPDDISLPPLPETPESIIVHSENDLDDGFCPSSHGQSAPGCGHRGQDEGAPGTKFRVESSSFVRSPLTVPTPGLVSSTLSSILKSKLPPGPSTDPSTTPPPSPLATLQQTLYAVHESFTQTQECVHEVSPRPSNTHAPPPSLTTESDLEPEPGLCKPTAIREEVRLLSGSRPSPGLPGKAPSFSKLLSNATVMEGSPVTLEVEVVGSPEPTLTWYKNGRKVTAGEHIDVSHKDGKHALFIGAVGEGDAGLYVARAVNSSGTLSSSAALQVKVQGYAPQFLQGLEDKALLVGEDLFLDGVVSGRPACRVTWTKDGVMVACGESRVQSHSDTHVLLKRGVGLSDSGEYIFVATKEEGQTLCSAHIVVTEQSRGVPEDPQEGDSG